MSTTILPLDRRARPLRDLRVSVIETCNFRCPYCMPADATPDETQLDRERRLSFEQIETTVRAFVALGVNKVRLTGGEPLLRKGLPDLVARLVKIEGVDDLALTTNGSLLAAQAQALRDAGLKRLTISLDALDPQVFSAMSGGRGNLRDVLAGIDAAQAAGFARLKFNCVVQRGVNESQVIPLVERFRGTPHVLRFIEYMDVGNCNGWKATDVVSSAELHHRINSRWPLRPVTPTYRGEVATRYGFVDGGGEVGFVSSVSEPFCGDCHRARLSADGHLYTCLFASRGHDLREAIGQGEAAVRERVGSIWTAREDRYSELRAVPHAERKKIEMYFIGG
jgi:cyclic pyranopterin phosphate synthase